MTGDELDGFDKAVLYVMGSLDELIGRGLAHRVPEIPHLTDKGRDEYRRLRDGGYRPTDQEIAYAVSLLKAVD